MKILRFAFATVATLALLASGQRVRADLLGSLNPFGAKTSTPNKPASNSPSMLSKIAHAPANMFSKTKQMLTPSKAPAKKPTLGTPSGSHKFNKSGSTKAAPPTASQFIGRQRPGF